MFDSLRRSKDVQTFMRTEEYEAGKLIVDAALCDLQLGFNAFCLEEFGFQPNTCVNHHLGICAANYTHRKHFLSQENMDKWYDRAVRMANIGLEPMREKPDVLMENFMVSSQGRWVQRTQG